MRDARRYVPAVGTFISVPGAFEAGPAGLRDILKMEFKTRVADAGDASRELELETVYTTDLCLIDLGAADVDAIDPDAIARDCSLIQRAVQQEPDKVRQLVRAFDPEAPLSDLDDAFVIAQELGLTEEATAAQGGGLLPLLAVAAAALLLGGCAHTKKHKIPDKR